VNDIFKKLQAESPPVQWETMRKIVTRELGEKADILEIDPTPMAAASIGQVHAAKRGDELLALKIQYEGIDAAVDTDLKLLKFILNVSEMVPRGPRFDQVFAEIRTMFKQEVDYDFERAAAEKFRAWLAADERYKVPFIDPEFSTKRVLTMERLKGVRADHADVQALSQERRNRLGVLFLELYLRELLEFQLVQTDPHLGNYLIEIDATGANDRLVLLDFGAVRDVPDDFLNHYRLLIEGGINRDARMIEKGGRMLGLLQPEDSLELVKDYVDLCFLLTEPFQSVYDWGKSDLPKRVATAVGKIATSYRLRAPPRELVFLDRKLGGVFIFLSVLNCVMDAKPVVENALKKNSAAE
jgi:predicted unusual protein kinase regulating ubiquinone biosynthesis (AarF/ABC1/UbiB family)